MLTNKLDYMLENSKSQDDLLGKTILDETIGNQQVTQKEIGWLAGIVDGEGYLGLVWVWQYRGKKSDRRAQPQLHITNCDEMIILKCQMIMRKISLNPYIHACKGYGKVRKDSYRIQLKNIAKIYRLLSWIKDDLTGNKKDRAEIIYEFCTLRMNKIHNQMPYTQRELELVALCQPLIKRGTSETIRQEQRQTGVIWNMMKSK